MILSTWSADSAAVAEVAVRVDAVLVGITIVCALVAVAILASYHLDGKTFRAVLESPKGKGRRNRGHVARRTR